MSTERELGSAIGELERAVRGLRRMLPSCSKADFMAGVDRVEGLCKGLRGMVIVHSRALGRGVTKDGRPDRRFRRNRVSGLTAAGVPDLRYGRSRGVP